MAMTMRILNVTPDSFWKAGRGDLAVLESGADIVDIGAVSTRPGAEEVSLEEEWRRLEPALRRVLELCGKEPGSKQLSSSELAKGQRDKCLRDQSKVPVISIDTTRSEIVKRAYGTIGSMIVNDISAGEDDPAMLETVGALGLPFVAMHKRGNSRTMDSLCDYSAFVPNQETSAFLSNQESSGVVEALIQYFKEFEEKAFRSGIENWILDPGLGFAKTPEQCWEILRRLGELKVFNRPILVAHADKRFTRIVPDGNALALGLALAHGAAIVRIH